MLLCNGWGPPHVFAPATNAIRGTLEIRKFGIAIRLISRNPFDFGCRDDILGNVFVPHSSFLPNVFFRLSAPASLRHILRPPHAASQPENNP